MKVTIVGHEPSPLGSAEELHRFHFAAHDGWGLPRKHEITLRTARVIVGNLDRDDAVTKMLRSILSTERADYDTLISNTYWDDTDASMRHVPPPPQDESTKKTPYREWTIDSRPKRDCKPPRRPSL